MADLTRYHAKRNFSVTPEPSGTEGADVGSADDHAGWRRFVVQKHWASSLHYDFRLEWKGTLKSWAVPKGPSLDTHDKRMAVEVEDHPLSYASFEGTIPAKQYGAGRVIVWDEGWWQPLGDADAALQGGSLKFELKGHKLTGKWVLVRMKGRGEKQAPWLLIKEKDQFARPASKFSVVDEMPDSVVDASSVRDSPVAAKPDQKPLVAAPRAALPASLAPQLATLAESAPADGANWMYELKFDGYRLLARVERGAVALFTRNGLDWSAKLRALQRSLKDMGLPDGWYDGEIVVPDDQGRPDFGALQQSFEDKKTGDIVFYLFDLPYCDGEDLREQPLEVRRAKLQAILAERSAEQVRFSEAFDAPAESVKASACKLGLEGVIGKRRDAAYRSGRNTDWIKLKCLQRQEFVIGGYTDPAGSRSNLGALLLGVFDAKGELRYAGNVGSGFSEKALGDLHARLLPLATPTRPFATTPIAGRPHWVEPSLMAEISFAGWTAAGRVRHAVFQGLRTDKPAIDIRRETPVAAAAIKEAGFKQTATEKTGATRSAPPAPGLRVTHGERVVDASTGISKLEIVRHYEQVGALMMVHLKGRPLSWVRAPSGLAGELFFQKHADVSRMADVREGGEDGPEDSRASGSMLEVLSAQGLLSAAQWNVIEFHTSNFSAPKLLLPDRMVFDLDPGDGVTWARVQEAAQVLRNFLDQLGLPAFLKTSGGKGLHVLTPLRRAANAETVKAFSHHIVDHLRATLPQWFVAKSGPKNRVGKIFIDYLRNGPGATTVAAWSVRARPGLGVSVPVEWDELASLRGGDHWTLRSVGRRLAIGNSPWAGYAKAATGLGRAMKIMDFKPPPSTSL